MPLPPGAGNPSYATASSSLVSLTEYFLWTCSHSEDTKLVTLVTRRCRRHRTSYHVTPVILGTPPGESRHSWLVYVAESGRRSMTSCVTRRRLQLASVPTTYHRPVPVSSGPTVRQQNNDENYTHRSTEFHHLMNNIKPSQTNQ